MGRHSGLILVLAAAALAACDSSSEGTSRNTDGGTGGNGGLSSGGNGGRSSGGNGGRSSGGNGASTGGRASSTGGVRGEGGTRGGAGNADAGIAGRDSGGRGSLDASADGSTPTEAGTGDASGNGGAGGNAADGGRDGEGGDAGPPLREFGYIAARFGGLLTCAIDLSNGVATQLGATIGVPRSEPVAITVHPSQKFLYVAYLDFQDALNFIDVYPIRSDGTLNTAGKLTVSAPDSVQSIVVEPQGHFAYAVTGAGKAIHMYRVDADTGALTELGTPLIVGGAADPLSPTFIAADPTGRFVYVSLAFGNRIFGYRIERAGAQPGTLAELASSPFGIPGLPDGSSVFGGAIAITPDGHFLYTSGAGQLDAYAIDDAGAPGALTPVSGSPFSRLVESDAPAPNLAVDPKGKHVYATQFHSGSALHAFSVQTGGALTKLSEPLTAVAPYSVAVEPSGHFLYVPNDANTLTRYSIAPSGALTELGQSQFGGLEAKMVFAKLP